MKWCVLYDTDMHRTPINRMNFREESDAISSYNNLKTVFRHVIIRNDVCILHEYKRYDEGVEEF